MLDEDSDDEDRFGGGKAMKEALRQMSAGKTEPSKPLGWSAGGPVKGGEILTLVDERLQRTSG
jgi:gamma-tubulin complex component 2